MPARIASLINRGLGRLGLELRRTGQAAAAGAGQDPRSSYMDEPRLQDSLLDELADTAVAALDRAWGEGALGRERVRAMVAEFWHTYRNRPFRDNRGGSGFHNAFWLFLCARALAPPLIVESGVWQGQTSWLFRQACPDAEFHGFDLDLGRLQVRDASLRFHEHDWSEFRFDDVDPERALVFFDCHVDHARRICEAGERGFRHLLFDDNPPLHKLYAYGLPGFPTVDMVCSCELDGPAEVAWHWRGEPRRLAADPALLARARGLVERYFVFPDVGGPTRYGGFSFLSYVRLAAPGGC